MTKKRATTILVILFIMQIFWITGFIIIGDFYPTLTTAKVVFEIKSLINGLACCLGLLIYVMGYNDLKETK